MADRDKPLWMERWFQILLGSLVLLTVASLAVPWLLGLIYALRSVLLPLVIALGLAYIFNPIVTWMHRRLRLPRWAGTMAVFVGVIWVVLILGLIIWTPLKTQSQQLLDKAKTWPDKISQIAQELSVAESDGVTPIQDETPTNAESAEDVAASPADDSPDQIEVADDTSDDTGPDAKQNLLNHIRSITERALGRDRATELLAGVADWFSQMDWQQIGKMLMTSFGSGVGIVGSAISLTGYLALSAVVIAFCFFFFSWKLDKLIAWFVPFIPMAYRNEVLGVMVQMDKSIAAFIRGRLIQAGVMAVILSFGWWLAGVPFWLLLGILSGMLNLVPFAAVVGFLVALLLTTIDSVAGGSFSVWVLIWPTFVYVLAQVLDGWVVEPIIQGKATDLDPVSVLVAVMVGGALAGLLGMLIAIPTAACIKILSREVILPRLRKLAAGEAG